MFTVTPDGKYAVSGSIDAKTITVVDLQSEQAVWDLNLGSGVASDGVRCER